MRLITFLVIFVKPSLVYLQPVTPPAFPPLPPSTPEAVDFNFNNKNYLKEKIKILVDCILAPTPPPPFEPLLKEVLPNGQQGFVFKYNGSRQYQESCLGDAYKKDLIRRLYDAGCKDYTEKFKFLNEISCDAAQNLECRKIGDEPNRAFAEPHTPITQCLCPNYLKPHTFMHASIGYYERKRRTCVIKAGHICPASAQGHDARLSWTDFDYVDPSSNQTSPISIVDLRPIPTIQTCVEHAFCYINDSRGLPLSLSSKRKCVCEAGYFRGIDKECHLGREPANWFGTLLAAIMFIVGLVAILGGILFH